MYAAWVVVTLKKLRSSPGQKPSGFSHTFILTVLTIANSSCQREASPPYKKRKKTGGIQDRQRISVYPFCCLNHWWWHPDTCNPTGSIMPHQSWWTNLISSCSIPTSFGSKSLLIIVEIQCFTCFFSPVYYTYTGKSIIRDSCAGLQSSLEYWVAKSTN